MLHPEHCTYPMMVAAAGRELFLHSLRRQVLIGIAPASTAVCTDLTL